jgi:hypothetical protein
MSAVSSETSLDAIAAKAKPPADVNGNLRGLVKILSSALTHAVPQRTARFDVPLQRRRRDPKMARDDMPRRDLLQLRLLRIAASANA